MIRRSFTSNPNFCLLDTEFRRPRSICVFDTWSVHHFFWQGAFYIFFHQLLNIKDIKHSITLFIILSIVHTIEEYLGNTSKISLEGIFIDTLGPLVDPKVKPEKREIDNDYIENSIGDVVSGMISNILIVIYWYKFGSLPYWYLLLFIPVFANLLSHSERLH